LSTAVFTSRKSGLTLLQAQQWAGSLTVLAAFGACAASGELGPFLMLLFPLGLIGAHFYGARVAGKAEWAWTLFLGAALIFFAFAVVAGQLDIVLAAARFALLLCFHRLWHRKGERDELLLLLLSLLLLCAGAALSAELLFGVGFIFYSITGTWALALTHLRFEIEAGRGPEGSAALLQSRRLATPALLGALAALSLLGLVGSAVVFFTFPRVTIGGLRRPSTGKPVAGLGDQVDLRAHGTIADDPRVVLRVRLSPKPQDSIVDLGLHWRARALSIWTGQGWRAQQAAYGAASHWEPRPVLGKQPRGKRQQQVLTADIEAVAGFSDGVILTPPGWPIHVEFQGPLSARGPAQRVYRNSTGDLFYQPTEVGDLRYVVVVDQNEPGMPLLRGRGRDYPPSVKADLAVPPSLDPRVKALSERLTAGRDPIDAAAEVERYLSSTFGYTLELAGEQKDPIAFFLFERKQGHCELFSSAMVILLRIAGIPARNVTGYYGGRRTDAGYYAVRAGDAHSWVEVYVPGAGYIPFDPTPAAARGSQQEGLWARLVLLWDTVQERWRAFVVDYDLLSQAQFLRRAGALLTEAGRRLSGKGGGGAAFQAAWAKTIGLVLALALAALLLVRRRRGLRQAARGQPLDPDQRRALKLWRRARGRLARAGVAVNEATTAREAAARSFIAGPVAAAAVAELARSCLAARWGGAPLPPESARALLRKLDSALRPG
jgi:hypothetical protein